MGRRVRRTARGSNESRWKKKLLAKSLWFKKCEKSNTEYYEEQENKPGGGRGEGGKKKENVTVTSTKGNFPTSTVLFVEQTIDGELAKRMRKVVVRLAPLMGFTVKVVERTGLKLNNKFSQDQWKGTPCGRSGCITCTQGGEQVPPCTKRSVLYENFCGVCNEGVLNAKNTMDFRTEGTASVYIGKANAV